MQRKPVSRFYDNHQFLLIHRAMEMKLVTVTVDYGEVELDAILAQFFLSDRLNHVAEMWNDERRAILDASVRTILIPKFRKEIVQDLLQRAQQHIVDSCCSHFSQVRIHHSSIPTQRISFISNILKQTFSRPFILHQLWQLGKTVILQRGF